MTASSSPTVLANGPHSRTEDQTERVFASTVRPGHAVALDFPIVRPAHVTPWSPQFIHVRALVREEGEGEGEQKQKFTLLELAVDRTTTVLKLQHEREHRNAQQLRVEEHRHGCVMALGGAFMLVSGLIQLYSLLLWLAKLVR